MPPFWQALVNDNQLTNPEFSSTPFVDNASADGEEEPGGMFTFSGTNTTFFDGDPDFQPFISSQTGGLFDSRPCAVSDELRDTSID